MEFTVAGALALQDRGAFANVVKGAARATSDDRLLDVNAALADLFGEVDADFAAQKLVHILACFGEDIARVGDQVRKLISVGWMEGQRDHRLDLGKVDLNDFVIVCERLGLQLLIIRRPAAHRQILLDFVIGLPNGGKTGGLGGHNVDAVAVLDG